MEKNEIYFDKDGFVTSVSEEIWDGYGHSEGGYTPRESPNFPRELKRHLEIGSVADFMRIIKKIEEGSQDPILRRVVGEILVEQIKAARPIIKETFQAQIAEEKARKEAEERAKTQPSIKKRYLTDMDGNGKWYYVVFNPDGSFRKVLGPVDSFEEPPTVSSLEEVDEGDRGL